MTTNKQPSLNVQIYDEATEWLIEFRAGDVDAEDRRRFDDWLRKSPEHVRAYLEIAAIWNEGPDLDPGRRYDIEALTAAARADDNIVPLISATWVQELGISGPSQAAQKRRSGPTFLTIAATILIAILGAGSWLYSQRGTYSTDIGEQRSVRLDDGSVIDLNSRSRIRVRYSEQQRDVELLEGQALFKVAKDKSRPFVVATDRTQVRAVGTQFDVYRKSTGTVVTVVEGRVAVFQTVPVTMVPDIKVTGTISPAEILLAAGEQVTIASLVPDTKVNGTVVASANLANATAWTQRQIVFDSATLPEVAEEFNRYNTRQLIIAHGTPDDFHISGIFSSTDPDSLIRFLRARPDISISETPDAIAVSRKDEAPMKLDH